MFKKGMLSVNNYQEGYYTLLYHTYFMGALSVNSRYIYIFAGDVDDSMIRILCMTESKKSDWDGRWVI